MQKTFNLGLLILMLTACVPETTSPVVLEGYSSNLIVNGNAEQGTPSNTASPAVNSIAGWSRPAIAGSDNATMLTYQGYKSSYNLTITAGNADLGNALFMGGVTAQSSIAQEVSLSNQNLDATKTHNLILNALLGGAENENDHTDLLLEGLNTNGEITVSIPVNGPRATERNNTTQLLAFKRETTLPAGTVSLRFKVTFLRESGTWNEAFMDNLDVRVKLD